MQESYQNEYLKTVSPQRIDTFSCQYHYINIKDTLKNIFGNDDMVKFLLEEINIRNNYLKSFFDGNIYDDEESVIRIQLYIDDFTLSNPLRHNSEHQKITAVYLNINSFKYIRQCKVNDIFLVLLCKRRIMKESFEAIFQPL